MIAGQYLNLSNGYNSILTIQNVNLIHIFCNYL